MKGPAPGRASFGFLSTRQSIGNQQIQAGGVAGMVSLLSDDQVDSSTLAFREVADLEDEAVTAKKAQGHNSAFLISLAHTQRHGGQNANPHKAETPSK